MFYTRQPEAAVSKREVVMQMDSRRRDVGRDSQVTREALCLLWCPSKHLAKNPDTPSQPRPMSSTKLASNQTYINRTCRKMNESAFLMAADRNVFVLKMYSLPCHFSLLYYTLLQPCVFFGLILQTYHTWNWGSAPGPL